MVSSSHDIRECGGTGRRERGDARWQSDGHYKDKPEKQRAGQACSLFGSLLQNRLLLALAFFLLGHVNLLGLNS
jgi:hypothetical protein